MIYALDSGVRSSLLRRVSTRSRVSMSPGDPVRDDIIFSCSRCTQIDKTLTLDEKLTQTPIGHNESRRLSLLQDPSDRGWGFSPPRMRNSTDPEQRCRIRSTDLVGSKSGPVEMTPEAASDVRRKVSPLELGSHHDKFGENRSSNQRIYEHHQSDYPMIPNHLESFVRWNDDTKPPDPPRSRARLSNAERSLLSLTITQQATLRSCRRPLDEIEMRDQFVKLLYMIIRIGHLLRAFQSTYLRAQISTSYSQIEIAKFEFANMNSDSRASENKKTKPERWKRATLLPSPI